MDFEIGITILIAVLGSTGLSSLIMAILQHHWNKDSSVTIALKVLLTDRIRHLGKRYIQDGQILLDDKENLKQMHNAYKGLGGNGDLDIVMSEVEKLQIV